MICVLDFEERYFIPAFFGAGIASFFYMFSVPELLIGMGLVVGLYGCFYHRYFIFLCLFCLGYLWIIVRTLMLGTQFLQEPLRDVVMKGIVENVEISQRNQRVTIKVKKYQEEIPKFVLKVKLRAWKNVEVIPGQMIKCLVDLEPFQEKVTPYSFDAKRDAFYKKINATGEIRKVLAIYDLKRYSMLESIERLRKKIARKIRSHIKAPEREIAVALTVGEKSAIPQKVRNYFTDSGTAHILSISGMHLGIIGVFVMTFVSLCLSFAPVLHERYPVYKWSAVIAWFFLLGYMLISGAGYPVQRAFIMATLFMIGIVIDRRTLSLYSVCWAAFLIMIIRPESIMSPGFQLSFSAVIPLIAMYEKRRISSWMAPLVSTLTASIGTLPVSIVTFKYVTLQALTGNLIILPFFSYVIMPLTVFVLAGVGFYPLEVVLGFLIRIAAFISTLGGAHIAIPATTQPYFVLLFLSGGIWICLIQNKMRFWGVIPILISPLFYFPAHAPNLLISPDHLVRAWRVQEKVFYTENRRCGRFYFDEWEKVYAIRIYSMPKKIVS